MNEPKKKHEEKAGPTGATGGPGAIGQTGPQTEPKTEVPDTKHHYPDPVGSLTNPKPVAKEALKTGPTSQGDALGAAAQS